MDIHFFGQLLWFIQLVLTCILCILAMKIWKTWLPAALVLVSNFLAALFCMEALLVKSLKMFGVSVHLWSGVQFANRLIALCGGIFYVAGIFGALVILVVKMIEHHNSPGKGG